MNISMIVRPMQRLFAGAALLALLSTGPAFASPASGYWLNPNTPGSGFVIEIQGSQMFMAGFLYSANGSPSWVASAGAMASSTQYAGTLITYSGGQTLTGAYRGATLAPALGSISISFLTDTTGSITWPGGTIPIQRFDIVPGGSTATQPATNPQTGWWWNPNEGGRGFAIEVQEGQMYLAAYMYDTSGNPTWYLANSAMSNSGVFQGQWTTYGSGQTLTGAYVAPHVTNANAGSAALQFTGTNSATLTLPDGRQIPLARFNFGLTGPVLSAFSPASAAPAGVLKLTGTGFDPTAALSITLSDSTGYSVSVAPASASPTSLTAAIPPYFNSATGVFGSGTVNVKLTQTSGAASADSNSLTGFKIQALPAAAGTAGNSTLSLIRANLTSAQKLQTSIKGTAQDSATVEAQIAAQVADLQKLVQNVQSVIQSATSFTLGVVGGVNITVSQSNIADVDNLILATLQSLASPPTGSSEKGAQAATPACLSAEAEAFASAILAGQANFDTLAAALVQAPNSSVACNSAAAFAAAYQIFGGAGAVGIGIINGAGSASVPAAKLPGAALFAAANSHASTELGLNALLSPTLATQTAAVQSAISGVTALAQAATNEVIAKATGDIATNLGDSSALINTVAPPASSGSVPTNLPTGTYSIAVNVCENVPGVTTGNTCTGDEPVESLPNTDPNAFAAQLEQVLASACTTYGTGNSFTCSSSVSPFNGSVLTVTWNISASSGGTTASFVVTYTITKTG